MDSSNQTKQDLSLVSIDELLAELYKRHDAVIFAAKIHKNVQQYSIIRKWYGHLDSCRAMCSNLEFLMNEAENKSLGPTIE